MRKTSDLIWQDAQHQVLFEILDMIGQPGSGPEVLLRLREYTETHFSLEERYMELLQFPGTELHVKAHDRFRKEIDSLGEKGLAEDATLVATYLRSWLTSHVFGVDKELEAFILQSSAK